MDAQNKNAGANVRGFLGAHKCRFPQNRIEKLMSQDRNCGLTSRVLVEGTFIELTSQGLPTRQVFLGLTSDELIFVIQEIPPKTNTKTKSDLILEGLVIDAIYPFSNITIIPSTNRFMAFSVVTPGNKIFHFEMCKLDATFRNQWNVWRTMIEEICERQQMNNSKNSNPSKGSDIEINVTQFPSNSSSSESDMGVRSVDSCDLVNESIKYGSYPSRRLGFFYGGHSTIHSPVYKDTDAICQLRKSSSWNDLVYDTNTVSGKIDVTLLKKVLGARDRSNKTGIQKIPTADYDADTDSDDDIDAVFDEVRTTQQKTSNVRSAAQLWCLAKDLTMGDAGSSFHRQMLEQAVNHVVFQAMSTRKKPIAESIFDCRPQEIAHELTMMSRALLMALRPRDLQQYSNARSKHTPMPVHNIKVHGEMLCKFVISEILSHRGLSEQVDVLTFFIEVCNHLLFTENDLNTLIYILRGMTSLPVYRLENTWATFFVQEPIKFSMFQAFISLLSPVDHYRSYTTRVQLCNRRQAPYIPWFDHFLLHCLGNTSSQNKNGDSFNPYILVTKSSKAEINENVLEGGVHEIAKVPSKEKSRSQKGNAKMMSILKTKKRKGRYRKLKKLFSLFKRKQKKTVTFLLSEIELSRESEHEMNDSNLKHLAKTRIFPVEFRNNVTTSPGAVYKTKQDTYQYRSHLHNDSSLFAIRKYSEQLSREIIGDVFITISPLNKDLDEPTIAGERVREQFGKREEDNQVNKDVSRSQQSEAGGTANKSKTKEPSRTTRSGPSGWLHNKLSRRKDKKQTRADIHHVNLVQSDIDEIDNLLEGLPGHSNNDTPLKDDTMNKTLADNTRVQMKENGRKHDSEKKSDVLQKLEARRQSYVPPSVLRDRRKSLFEQAYDDDKDDDIEDEFAKNMDKQLTNIKGRRKSVAVELLEFNQREFQSEDNQSNNYNDVITPWNTVSRDWETPRTSHYPHIGDGSYADVSSRLMKSTSAEQLSMSCKTTDNCLSYDGDTGIYLKSPYDQLFLLQKMALDTHEHSSKRVRECLEKLLRAANKASYTDLLKLSLSME